MYLFSYSSVSLQRLQQLGVTPVATSEPPVTPPTRDQHSNTLPPRPDSLILGAPINHKEVQRRAEEDEQEEEEVGEEATESTNTERTVEGSSGNGSRKHSYGELEGTFNSELSKEEPAIVSLEFGVARMTCWERTGGGGSCGILRDRRDLAKVCACQGEAVALYVIMCWLRRGPEWAEWMKSYVFVV